jgi:hypothetical protein
MALICDTLLVFRRSALEMLTGFELMLMLALRASVPGMWLAARGAVYKFFLETVSLVTP